MKIKLNDVDSKIVKENSTYTLVDNTDLKNLVVSKTILHPMQETTGHKHDGQEEVYQCVSGHGYMDVGEKSFDVNPGDVILPVGCVTVNAQSENEIKDYPLKSNQTQ